MHAALPPHTLAAPASPPPPQVSGAVHVPQGMTLPQPSPCCPQFTPRLPHVAGTHAAVPPQTLGVPPPPQVCGALHGPHCRRPPHPSATGPQVAPASAHVRGVQVGEESGEPDVASPRRPGEVASNDFVPPSSPPPVTASKPAPLPHPARVRTHAAKAPQSQRISLSTKWNCARRSQLRQSPTAIEYVRLGRARDRARFRFA